jgi:hypothetical protein
MNLELIRQNKTGFKEENSDMVGEKINKLALKVLVSN